jgi:DNA-binding protein YbaB
VEPTRPTLDEAVDYPALRRGLTRLCDRLPDVRHRERSADGRIEVTVGGRGELLTLYLDPLALRTPDATALARDITATVHRATAAVRDQVHSLTVRLLSEAAAH